MINGWISKRDLKILAEIVSEKVDIGIVVNPVRYPDLIIKKLYDDQVAKIIKNRIVKTQNLEVIASLTQMGAGIGIFPERIMNLFDKNNEIVLLKGFPTFKDEHTLVYRYEKKNLKTIPQASSTIENSW